MHGQASGVPLPLPPAWPRRLGAKTPKSGVLAWNRPCWDGGLSGLPSSAPGASSHSVGSRNPSKAWVGWGSLPELP